MKRIINESFQDITKFLKGTRLRIMIENEFPEIKSSPESVEDEVLEFIIDQTYFEFPDDYDLPEITDAVVMKVVGNDTEIVDSSHSVIKFNGTLYDYTAHRYVDAFNDLLTYGRTPVIQSVITNDKQLNDGVSTVKGYALMSY